MSLFDTVDFSDNEDDFAAPAPRPPPPSAPGFGSHARGNTAARALPSNHASSSRAPPLPTRTTAAAGWGRGGGASASVTALGFHAPTDPQFSPVCGATRRDAGDAFTDGQCRCLRCEVLRVAPKLAALDAAVDELPPQRCALSSPLPATSPVFPATTSEDFTGDLTAGRNDSSSSIGATKQSTGRSAAARKSGDFDDEEIVYQDRPGPVAVLLLDLDNFGFKQMQTPVTASMLLALDAPAEPLPVPEKTSSSSSNPKDRHLKEPKSSSRAEASATDSQVTTTQPKKTYGKPRVFVWAFHGACFGRTRRSDVTEFFADLRPARMPLPPILSVFESEADIRQQKLDDDRRARRLQQQQQRQELRQKALEQEQQRQALLFQDHHLQHHPHHQQDSYPSLAYNPPAGHQGSHGSHPESSSAHDLINSYLQGFTGSRSTAHGGARDGGSDRSGYRDLQQSGRGSDRHESDRRGGYHDGGGYGKRQRSLTPPRNAPPSSASGRGNYSGDQHHRDAYSDRHAPRPGPYDQYNRQNQEQNQNQDRHLDNPRQGQYHSERQGPYAAAHAAVREGPYAAAHAAAAAREAHRDDRYSRDHRADPRYDSNNRRDSRDVDYSARGQRGDAPRGYAQHMAGYYDGTESSQYGRDGRDGRDDARGGRGHERMQDRQELSRNTVRWPSMWACLKGAEVLHVTRCGGQKQAADEVICEAVRLMDQTRPVLVASADKGLLRDARRAGALTFSTHRRSAADLWDAVAQQATLMS